MGMQTGVGVKTFLTSDYTHTDYQAFFFKSGDVPVYRAQRETGIAGLEAIINPFGGGMGIGAAQKIIYSFAFSAIPGRLIHFTLPKKTITITVSTDKITQTHGFVKRFG